MSPKLRRFLHIAAAEILYYSGALAVWRWSRRKLLHKDEVCVLGLHRVLTKSEQEQSNSLEGMIIRDETFAALLQHLQCQFQVISLDDFLRGTAQNRESSKPLCVITFDDGWADTFSRAFPELRKLGLPGAVFLATGSIGTCGGFWVEQLKRIWRNPSGRQRIRSALAQWPEAASADGLESIVESLKRMPTEKRNATLAQVLPDDSDSHGRDEVDAMLTWDHVREMIGAGIEIGAHTVTHPLLSYEDDAWVERELKLSKQTLEEKLGIKIQAFAYPNGDWNERVREQVASAGYDCAFTTKPRWYVRGENPFTISRVLLHEGNITVREGKFSPAMLDLTLAGWA